MGPNAVAPCNMIQYVTKIESHTTCICFWQSYEYCNGTVALPDTNFGWEPRALAPDLKSWTLSVTVLKFHVDRQNHKRNHKSKNTRRCRINNPISYTIHVASNFFDYYFSMILCKTLVAETLSSMFIKATVSLEITSESHMESHCLI